MVGPTNSVISSNWADSYLSKEGRALVPVISVRDGGAWLLSLGGLRVAPGMIRWGRGVVGQAESVWRLG